MSKCARPGCLQRGTSRCSTCLKEAYCNSDCQKADWKAHKLICKTVKRFSNQLQPYAKVVEIIREILKGPVKAGTDIRVVKHLLSYAEFQFGDTVPGNSCRQRKNGDRISNWVVEIEMLYPIYQRLINDYAYDKSLSAIIRDNRMFPYLEMILDLLTPWSLLIDSDGTSRIDRLDKGQINRVLNLSSKVECSITDIYRQRNTYDLAENHCLKALLC